MLFGRLSTFVHCVVERVLCPGGRAVDATVGNGHDTLFLARLVGGQGEVHGFDIQPRALERARAHLEVNNAPGCVALHQTSHERMAEVLPGRLAEQVDVVMFNLGYLPGADSRIVTTPATTLPAIDAALGMIRPGGVVTMMIYTGHPEGDAECQSVLAHLGRIPPDLAQVAWVKMHNHVASQVRLAIVEKGAVKKRSG